MNKLEEAYARLLAERPDVAWFGFERLKWKLAEATFWTPDFIVQLRNGELQAHEVKGGLFPEHNRVKFKVAADSLPMTVVLAQYKNKATGWIITEH